MMRLSAALTRRCVLVTASGEDGLTGCANGTVRGIAGDSTRAADGPENRAAIGGFGRLEVGGKLAVGVTSSSQDNIVISNRLIMRAGGKK